jgi:hypothetical protein
MAVPPRDNLFFVLLNQKGFDPRSCFRKKARGLRPFLLRQQGPYELGPKIFLSLTHKTFHLSLASP